MRNSLISAMLLILICPGFLSCSRGNEQEKKSDESALIEKVINNSIGWARNKDLNTLYNVIAGDDKFLEVHPDGRVVRGFEEFRQAEAFWMNPDFKAVSYEIKDLRICISESSTVAWWYCLLDDINEWKGEDASWKNTRWTGVVEKQNGRWVIVQQHFSFACE